jgi:hypothetical protein
LRLVGHQLVVVVLLLGFFPVISTVTPAFAPPPIDTGSLDHVYNLTVGNKTYPLRYGFSTGSNATVDDMIANVSSKSITLIVEDYGNDSISDWQRVFSIELPRNIVDANTTEAGSGCSYLVGGKKVWSQEHDVPYIVNVFSVGGSGVPAKYDPHITVEGCDRDVRTVSVEYPKGKSMIVVHGTVMIPEFDFSSSILIMTFGMIGAWTAASHFVRRDSK